jgi:GntR family transcriptional repressor for pyruvate dehydrogenase complex
MNPQRQSLIKEIYNAIRQGTILRGEKLFTERELSDFFKVKRSALREALVALEALGVIDIRDRQGMFLENKPTKLLSDSLDFLSNYSPSLIFSKSMEARIIIEPKSAAMAARKCTPAFSALLNHEIVFLKNLYVREDIDRRAKATIAYKHNIILHNMIIEISDNIVLSNIYNYLADLTKNVFSVLGQDPIGYQPYDLWFEELIEEHGDIVKAIVSQDPVSAERNMHEHLLNSEKRNSMIMSEIYPSIIAIE